MAVLGSRRGLVVVPLVNVMVVAALLFLAALAAEARPLGGGDGGWEVTGAGPLPSGGGGGVFIVEALRRLYLQQLSGPGASCQTNSPNNGCPP